MKCSYWKRYRGLSHKLKGKNGSPPLQLPNRELDLNTILKPICRLEGGGSLETTAPDWTLLGSTLQKGEPIQAALRFASRTMAKITSSISSIPLRKRFETIFASITRATIGIGPIFTRRRLPWTKGWSQSKANLRSVPEVEINDSQKETSTSIQADKIPEKPLRICLSTGFLEPCVKKVQEGENEELLYCSGYVKDGVVHIDRSHELDYDLSCPVRVRPTSESSGKVLFWMTCRGFEFALSLHWHPMRGEDGVRPSETDITTQTEMEANGYRTIGAIVNNDNYVRFFSSELSFEVELIGSDVERISENTYRLLEPVAPEVNMPIIRSSALALPSNDFSQLQALGIQLPAGAKSSITDRAEKCTGHEQSRIAKAKAVVIGCGGLACFPVISCARKGYGEVILVDPKYVDHTGYPRQPYYEKDLGNPKALSLMRNFAEESISRTVVSGFALPFQAVVKHLRLWQADLVYCLADNDETRLFAATMGLEHNVPVIFAGVGDDALSGYVFVQGNRSSDPCFGCAFPHILEQEMGPAPCPGTPAGRDILTTLGGYISYAADSILMPKRPRVWNKRYVFLDGIFEDGSEKVERNTNCPLCGRFKEEDNCDEV